LLLLLLLLLLLIIFIVFIIIITTLHLFIISTNIAYWVLLLHCTYLSLVLKIIL